MSRTLVLATAVLVASMLMTPAPVAAQSTNLLGDPGAITLTSGASAVLPGTIKSPGGPGVLSIESTELSTGAWSLRFIYLSRNSSEATTFSSVAVGVLTGTVPATQSVYNLTSATATTLVTCVGVAPPGALESRVQVVNLGGVSVRLDDLRHFTSPRR